jgi:hypothetical protein
MFTGVLGTSNVSWTGRIFITRTTEIKLSRAMDLLKFTNMTQNFGSHRRRIKFPIAEAYRALDQTK